MTDMAIIAGRPFFLSFFFFNQKKHGSVLSAIGPPEAVQTEVMPARLRELQ